MRLRDYQWRTDEFAFFPKNRSLEYLALGLASEGGEVAGVVKKIFRDDAGQITDENRAKLLDELSDVMWYAAQMATFLKADLEDDVLAHNIEKLRGRTARGTLRGSGDGR